MKTPFVSRTKRVFLTCAMLAAGAALTSLAQAQSVFRITTIPEEAATEQVRKFTPLATYLEKALGVKVEFTPVSDYPAAVETLVNKKVDLVWFGRFRLRLIIDLLLGWFFFYRGFLGYLCD